MENPAKIDDIGWFRGTPILENRFFFYSKAFPNLERLLSCQDRLDLGPSQGCMGPTLDFRCSTAMFFLTIHCWGSNHFDPHVFLQLLRRWLTGSPQSKPQSFSRQSQHVVSNAAKWNGPCGWNPWLVLKAL
jgi:hypothetical protein